MGWADCGADDRGRKIGYAFAAKCDHKGCKRKINRGLAHVCGGMHGGDGIGCGRYFCYEHMQYVDIDGATVQVCAECAMDHEG